MFIKNPVDDFSPTGFIEQPKKEGDSRNYFLPFS